MLRLGQGLVLLRLGDSNSYVWVLVLQILTFGG